MAKKSPKESVADGDDIAGRLARIEAQLESMAALQEAAIEGIGALAAARFGDPALTRDKKPEIAAWSHSVRGAVGEHLSLQIAARHGTAGSRPWVTRATAWAPEGSRVTLLGEYAESVAYAIAHSHTVTVVKPGSAPGVGAMESAHLPSGARPPQRVGCTWADLASAMPQTDSAVITDAPSAMYLLRRRNPLWHFVDRIDDSLIIEVPLSPTDNSFLRSRDGAFYCSDAWVRSALHYVRFMEVVNLLTLVDGLPRTTGACRQRVSRFTRRKGIAHVGKVRFLDDTGPERIRAKVGTPIRRVYLARKRPFSESDLAFARGEGGRP